MTEEATRSGTSLWQKMSNWQIHVVEAYKRKPISDWILLILSSGGMLVALPIAFLTGRIYCENGGTSKWIISWAAVAGWPITTLMLLPIYYFWKTCPTPLTLQLILSHALMGFLTVAHNMMFAFAYAYLPASGIATLLTSSLLVFSCLFGYLIANNKLNASIINATVIITAATTIIALDSDSDPKQHDNVSDHQYILGFVWDILASIIHALMFPLTELIFIKLLGRRSFHVVLEQQAMVSFLAFIFTTVGLIINKDIQTMKTEAKTFLGGEACYIKLLIQAAVTFQLGTLGANGVVFLTCTVTAATQNAVGIPITTIAAIIFLHDTITGFKILSFLLTLWGFSCYIYGH